MQPVAIAFERSGQRGVEADRPPAGRGRARRNSAPSWQPTSSTRDAGRDEADGAADAQVPEPAGRAGSRHVVAPLLEQPCRPSAVPTGARGC